MSLLRSFPCRSIMHRCPSRGNRPTSGCTRPDGVWLPSFGVWIASFISFGLLWLILLMPHRSSDPWRSAHPRRRRDPFRTTHQRGHETRRFREAHQIMIQVGRAPSTKSRTFGYYFCRNGLSSICAISARNAEQIGCRTTALAHWSCYSWSLVRGAVVWPGALLPALLSSGLGFGFMFWGGRCPTCCGAGQWLGGAWFLRRGPTWCHG